MQTYEPLISPARRRRRIALLACTPLVATLLVWWLESGNWLVVYNDSLETLVEVHVRSGDAQWTLRDLESRESRRLQVPDRDTAEVSVEVPNWSPGPSFRQVCDWRETTITTLRLDGSHAVVATSESGFWSRWLRW